MSSGQESVQRTHPTHPANFDLFGMYKNLCGMRWRQRAPCVSHGL